MFRATSYRRTPRALPSINTLTFPSGLPKKTETFFLFRIDEARIHQFRAQLAKLVPLITTTSQVVKDRERIAQHKQGSSERRGDQEILKDKRGPPSLLGMSGVNLAFTRKGLQKVGSTVSHPLERSLTCH